MTRGLTAETKALLINIGSADIDPCLLSADFKTTATAGPGAGGSSFFISSGSHRVRLSINPESSLHRLRFNSPSATFNFLEAGSGFLTHSGPHFLSDKSPITITGAFS